MTPQDRAHDAWRQAERLKILSDRLIGFGPIGIGLDGIVAWIPGLNFAYGMIAGTLMLVQGVRAGAEMGTLARMILYVIVDNVPDVLTLIPGLSWLAGSLFDTVFRGHLMAAEALQKDIQARHGPPLEIAQRRAVQGKKPDRPR